MAELPLCFDELDCFAGTTVGYVFVSPSLDEELVENDSVVVVVVVVAGEHVRGKLLVFLTEKKLLLRLLECLLLLLIVTGRGAGETDTVLSIILLGLLMEGKGRSGDGGISR